MKKICTFIVVCLCFFAYTYTHAYSDTYTRQTTKKEIAGHAFTIKHDPRSSAHCTNGLLMLDEKIIWHGDDIIDIGACPLDVVATEKKDVVNVLWLYL